MKHVYNIVSKKSKVKQTKMGYSPLHISFFTNAAKSFSLSLIDRQKSVMELES